MNGERLDMYLKEERKRLEEEKIRLHYDGFDRIYSGAAWANTEDHFLEENAANDDLKGGIHHYASAASTGARNDGYHSALEYVENCPAADLLNRRALSAPNPTKKVQENLNVLQCQEVRSRPETHKASADFSTCSNEDELRTSKYAKERANVNAKCRSPVSPTRQRKEEMMEGWVSDTFYSYFPSFNVLDQKRQNLAKDRQREYQEYLKKVSEEKRTNRLLVKNNKIAPSPENYSVNNQGNTESNPGENINNDDQNQNTPTGSKLKHLQDLKHTSLSTLMNSAEVSEINKEITESEKKKKIEYQQQLLKQIEEKRKEVEELKRREKQAEELLSKKIEEQIKTMQLEDELEKEKLKAEKIRLNIEQNQAMQMKLLKKLDDDEKFLDRSNKTPIQDNKVYKYFSNSSRANDYDKYSHESFFELSDSESDDVPTPNIPGLLTKNRCKSCKKGMKTSKCLSHRNILAENIDQQSNQLACKNCQKPFQNMPSKERDSHCFFCHSQRNMCVDCMRNVCTYCGEVTYSPTPMTSRSLPIESGRLSQASSNKSFKVLDLSYDNLYQNDKNENNPNASRKLISDKSLSNSNPAYSVFIPEAKIIEPKLNISARDILQKREAKAEISNRLSKYLKNYGDLSDRSHNLSCSMKSHSSKNKSSPSSMPLLREPPKRKITKISDQPANQLTQTKNIKVLSQKWEVPAVQKNIVSSSSGVLTQLGAFKKQLQIDNLELDEPSNEM